VLNRMAQGNARSQALLGLPYKALLTSQRQKFEAQYNSLKMGNPFQVPVNEPERTTYLRQELVKKQSGLDVLENCLKALEERHDKWIEAISRSPNSENEYDDYVNFVQNQNPNGLLEFISVAYDCMDVVRTRLTEIQLIQVSPVPASQQAAVFTAADSTFNQLSKLTFVYVPKFAGRHEEWLYFWTLFNETVHSKPLPVMDKYVFMLSRLEGSAL